MASADLMTLFEARLIEVLQSSESGHLHEALRIVDDLQREFGNHDPDHWLERTCAETGALINAEHGKTDAALELYNRAAKLLPPATDFVNIQLGIACVLERTGDISQAIEALERALQAATEPNAVPTAYSVLKVYARIVRSCGKTLSIKWEGLFRAACARRGIPITTEPIADAQAFTDLVLGTQQ